MHRVCHLISVTAQCLTLGLALTSTASAHLMVAQHGTLNILSNGAFMVLSVPIAAFEGVDDDSDGKLSKAEFEKHHSVLSAKVKSSILLHDKNGPIQIQGLLLSSEAADHKLAGPVTHIVAMGRFVLKTPDSPLRFENKLFGKVEKEKALKFSVTRKSDGLKQTSILTPIKPITELFPSKDS